MKLFTYVVGFFPNLIAIIRLVGSQMQATRKKVSWSAAASSPWAPGLKYHDLRNCWNSPMLI
jgi:hypothetical protein